MTNGQPSTRSTLRWLLPVVVGVLVLVGTVALAVRQTTVLPDQRLDPPDLGLFFGILVAVCCVVGLILFLLTAPSAVAKGPVRKKKKNNWLARLISVGALLLLVLWVRDHNKNGALNNPLTAFGMGGNNGKPVTAPPVAPTTDGSGPVIALLVVVGVLVVAAAVVGVVIARRVARDDLDDQLDEPEFDDQGLDAALVAARAATFVETDPRSVVIGCYEIFERVLETRGVTRHANQTASTALDRALIRGMIDGEGAVAARDLIDVFERARFSPHEMADSDVVRARTALDAIQASVGRSRVAFLAGQAEVDETSIAPDSAVQRL
jgi:hypothetical protein